MGDRRCAYRISGERPEGKRPLGRPRCRLEDNIKLDHQKFGWGHALDLYESEYERDAALVNFWVA
jgi:hypothetical protein